MSVFCIGGICIPYSVIWPFILIALKQIWDWISGGKTKVSNLDQIKANQSSTKIEGPLGAFYLTKDFDFDALINEEFVVFVRFTAPWCKPCKVIYERLWLKIVHNIVCLLHCYLTKAIEPKWDSIAADHKNLRFISGTEGWNAINDFLLINIYFIISGCRRIWHYRCAAWCYKASLFCRIQKWKEAWYSFECRSTWTTDVCWDSLHVLTVQVLFNFSGFIAVFPTNLRSI